MKNKSIDKRSVYKCADSHIFVPYQIRTYLEAMYRHINNNKKKMRHPSIVLCRLQHFMFVAKQYADTPICQSDWEFIRGDIERLRNKEITFLTDIHNILTVLYDYQGKEGGITCLR